MDRRDERTVQRRRVPVEGLKLLTAIIVALAIAAPSIQRWAAFQRRKAAAKGKEGN